MWEYLAVNNGAVGNDGKKATDFLNDQAKQGWELITVIGPMFYFKKAKAAAAQTNFGR